MIQGYTPVIQALLGTLLTWGLTALGAGFVVVFSRTTSQLQRKLLDGSLGFAAGVMLSASYFSLLNPAVEMAESSGMYGEDGQFAFFPLSVGFLLGGLFVELADQILSKTGSDPVLALAHVSENPKKEKDEPNCKNGSEEVDSDHYYASILPSSESGARRRKGAADEEMMRNLESNISEEEKMHSRDQWKRILLLIVAVTVHNIPEGLAVGVGFGAVGTTPSATFESARNLAIGIGIQNFPEGLAVSLPLKAAGYSTFKSFWYGQLSGMVEPIAGVIGALAVQYMTPVLPYALAFAAGAMIFVVFDDIMPEARSSGNEKLSTWTAIFGFITMMILDVGLG